MRGFRIIPHSGPLTSISHVIHGFRFLFLAVGILALSYCATVLVERTLFQADQSWRFEHDLKASQKSVHANQSPASLPRPATMDSDGPMAESFGIDGLEGSPLGRIEINSVGLAAMIMEGADGKTLRRAVGHIPGTALPGQQGNVALSGHRDTFFRGLRNVQVNDEITLTTPHSAWRYSVDSTQVVEPDDVKVLRPTADDVLTLVTCYPFYFVGPAPKRFVVRAHRISQ